MEYVSERIRKIVPYKAGEQTDYVFKLNTNENPYAPSPKVKKALKNADIAKLKLYPDQNNTLLKISLAKRYGVTPDMVFVGNGSDELLALMNIAFFDGPDEKAAYPDVTYSFYPVYNELFRIKAVTPPLKDGFTIDLKDYANLDVKGIIIANPNAPTGVAIKAAKLIKFIAAHPEKLFVIDEAYADFCKESLIPYVAEYSNILIIRTFSKGYSLAGIRCGYAIGNAKLIDGMKKVKDCFNNYPVDYLTELIASAAVEDADYYRRINGKVMRTRKRITIAMRELGFVVPESSSNFIFASHPAYPAEKLYKELKARGILVRHWNKPRIENYLRITMGTDPDMDLFIKVIREILDAGKSN